MRRFPLVVVRSIDPSMRPRGQSCCSQQEQQASHVGHIDPHELQRQFLWRNGSIRMAPTKIPNCLTCWIKIGIGVVFGELSVDTNRVCHE